MSAFLKIKLEIVNSFYQANFEEVPTNFVISLKGLL